MVVTLLALTALVAVNLVNGKAGGIAAYGGFGRPVTWLVTLVLFAALLAAAGFLIKKRVDGIFIDERNRISLSRVQLVLWTLLLVGALFTAALSNFSIGWPTPLQITVPPSVWALLGIGSFSFVAALAILNRLKAQGAAPTRLATIEARLRAADRFTGSVTATGPVVEKPTPQDAHQRRRLRRCRQGPATRLHRAADRRLRRGVVCRLGCRGRRRRAEGADGVSGRRRRLRLPPGAQPRRLPGLESGPEAVARGRRPSRPAPPPSHASLTVA
ncbi:MAG: hypothetical protein ACJ8C3_25615 [Microvirga sp.]